MSGRQSDLPAFGRYRPANSCHELLAAVRNATTIMRRTAWADPAHQSALGITERQIDHLIVLVQSYLDAGRLGQGKIKLDTRRILVAEVIRRAVDLVRPLVDSHRQSLIVSLPPRPVYVEGDVDRLTQVVSNLLHNAIKYTHDGGRLSIRLQRAGDEVVLNGGQRHRHFAGAAVAWVRSVLAGQRRRWALQERAGHQAQCGQLAGVPGLELNWTLYPDDGVRLARELQPDVILLHLTRAAIGDRLVRRLREQGRLRQPVVVGWTSDRDRPGVRGADCDHMLSKPLNVGSWVQLAATLRAGPGAAATNTVCPI